MGVTKGLFVVCDTVEFWEFAYYLSYDSTPLHPHRRFARYVLGHGTATAKAWQRPALYLA